MKKIYALLSMAVISAIASAAMEPFGPTGKLAPELRPLSESSAMPAIMLTPQQRERMHLDAVVPPIENNSRLRTRRAEPEMKEGLKLDSIVVNDDWHAELSKKQEFTYNEKGLPLLCRDLKYYADKKAFELWASEGFEWNDDGYCLDYWTIQPEGESGKVTYTLDEANYVLSKTMWNYVNADWVKSERVVYTYNENHQVLSEIWSAYVEFADTWIDTKRIYGEYDAKGRLINYTEQTYHEGDYEPLTETYEYNDANQIICLTVKNFDPSAPDKLCNYTKRTYEYGSYGKTVENIYYWNKDSNDWTGGYIDGRNLPNAELTYEYDTKGRMIAEHSSQMNDAGKMEELILTTWDYTDEADGAYKVVNTMFYPNSNNGEGEYISRFTQHFLAWGGIDYTYSEYTNGTELKPQFEITSTFNDAHNVLEWQQYNFVLGNRTPMARVSYAYETTGDEWSSQTQYGPAEEDAEDPWEPSIRIDRDFVVPDGLVWYRESSWAGEFGFQMEKQYDFELDTEVPLSDMITWPTYDCNYKCNSMIFATNNSRLTSRYYYSSAKVIINNVDEIEAETREIEVWNMQGVKVYTGEKSDMHISPGVYLIREGSKISKAIIK